MRKIVIVAFVFCSMIVFGQEKPSVKKSTINSIELSLDSSEDLKNIEWSTIKKIFRDKAKKDSISLSFKVKRKKNNKVEFKHSFKVEGISEDIDELISISKKTIKVLDKIKS